MKKNFLVLILALAFWLPRVNAASATHADELPSAFHSVYLDGKWDADVNCWIAKIDLKSDFFRLNEDGHPALAEFFTASDDGKFTVLRHVQSKLIGGGMPPQFIDSRNTAVSYEQAVKMLRTNEGCSPVDVHY